MIKPEWGTKRTCPKCATRFYDLAKDDPVTCINCGYAWEPEPILKSKQPLPFEAVKADTAKDDVLAGGDEDDLDIAVEEEEPSADDEVDLGGDDDLGVKPSTTTRKSAEARNRQAAQHAACQPSGAPLGGASRTEMGP